MTILEYFLERNKTLYKEKEQRLLKLIEINAPFIVIWEDLKDMHRNKSEDLRWIGKLKDCGGYEFQDVEEQKTKTGNFKKTIFKIANDTITLKRNRMGFYLDSILPKKQVEIKKRNKKEFENFFIETLKNLNIPEKVNLYLESYKQDIQEGVHYKL